MIGCSGMLSRRRISIPSWRWTITPGCMAMNVKPSPFSSFASCTVTARSTHGGKYASVMPCKTLQ